MRISKLPADEDHPYGHGKAEVLGSGFVAFILVIAALLYRLSRCDCFYSMNSNAPSYHRLNRFCRVGFMEIPSLYIHHADRAAVPKVKA